MRHGDDREWPSYRAAPACPRRCLLHAVPREHSADHKHVLRRDMKVYACHSITWQTEGRRIAAGSKPVWAVE